ncbi:hypothetical protein OS493_009255 [Desmophyllum pertusum]|uniref:Uncharacterized protein n=1 Tax=Desmophyllum pertusum TaxID=174260 RepID=A0A9W9Z2U5_9CNID|nr:hypothetical protein OS493_009255 [Desmophyllum pertusum]
MSTRMMCLFERLWRIQFAIVSPGVSAVCPIFEPPAECPAEILNLCFDDHECRQGMMCCLKECGEFNCIAPVPGPTVTPAASNSAPSKTPSTSSADNCGGVLTDPTGEITSPDYPKRYPNDVTCTWKISPETTHVNLTIEDFALESSKTCNEFDFVKIKVKASRYSTEEVVVCGSLSSRELKLKVEGNEVEITFTSDSSVNERGFNITYRSYAEVQWLYQATPRVDNAPGTGNAQSWSGIEGVQYYALTTAVMGRKTVVSLQDGKSVLTVPSLDVRTYHQMETPRVSVIMDTKEKNRMARVKTSTSAKKLLAGAVWGLVIIAEVTTTVLVHSRVYREKWHPSGQTCEDVDECKSRGYQQPIANCGDAVCVNTPGSYICQCEPGYKFNDTLKKCQDDDECTAESSGCDHVCTNANGSFSCSCHPGYFLDSDGKSCRAEKVGGLEGVHKSIACQGEPLTMKCKDSKDPLTTLIIFKAEYGRDIEVCPQKKLRKKIIAEPIETFLWTARRT